MDDRKRRVVVTGTGIVLPLGCDVPTVWRRILAGESGIARLESPDYESLATHLAGRVRGFDPQPYLNTKALRTYGANIQYGYVAAAQALTQSGLDLAVLDKDRAGVYVGSGAGGLISLLEGHRQMLTQGARRVSPHLIPISINNMVGGVIAIQTGFRGPNYAPVSACATGNHAIGEAYRTIAHGYADVMLAGGAEAPITPLYFAAFGNMRAMSVRNNDPAGASRPFDRERDGFVMAEGAGVLLLESLEHARQRGARILAELAGYGSTADAHHMTAPSPDGAARAMSLALQYAGLAPQAVGYINAHGTGTPAGDRSETDAIKAVFGAHAYRLKVSSTKSMTGHMFGAAGGAEAVFTVCCLQDGIIPPTVNLQYPDPDCDLDYVPQQAVRMGVEVALSNGFGFGGQNAVLAFRRYEA